jgi:F-box domain
VTDADLAMLASLASEVLLLILDRLSARALLYLRATCKGFLHIITPRVFSDYCFDLSNHRHVHRQLRYLQSLSNPSCTVAPYVTSLHIASLHTAMQLDDPLTSAIRTVLSQYLIPSISKLRNLETVR